MSRTNRGSKEVGYDYSSKRKGNKGYMCSPDYNAVGASMKQITTKRERCEFRSTFVIDLDDDECQ